MKTIFYNGKIFTGESFLDNSSVMVTDKKITSVGSRKNSSADESIDLKTDYLVPAFIDLQLYGGLGKLFGEHPSVDALTATYKYSLTGGATNILPTVATNSPEVMLAAIEAVKTYRQQQLPG